MYQARFAVQAREKSFPRQGAGVAVLPGRGSECEPANSVDRVREAILANMSHELRTPLHSVLMVLNQAREALADTPLADLCSQALVSGYNLNTLLSDILELTSLESGAARSQNAEFDPEALCTEVVELFRLPAREKQIALATYHEKNIPAVVMGDASRLRVVLMHIIGNALKFTKTGMVALHLGVASSKPNPGTSRLPYKEAPQKPTHPKTTPIPPHILATLPHDLAREIAEETGVIHHPRTRNIRLRLTVTDTGQGIPDADMDRIWEPFRRGDESLTQPHGGADLGLALVRRHVEVMGGVVELFSREGVGTTVRVEVEVREGRRKDEG